MRNQAKAFRRGLLLTLLALAMPTTLQAEEVTRFVEFRDGTRLQMTFLDDELPWREQTDEGELVSAPLSLNDVEAIHLIYLSPSRRLELVRQALEDLQSDDYIQREEAEQELLRLGGAYVPVLEDALEQGQEVDFLLRLSHVLEEITAVEVEIEQGDVYIDAEGNRHEGDLANWSPRAKAYGTTLTLDRRTIARIGHAGSENAMLSGPAVGLVRRIDSKERDMRFSGVMHIDFETGPEGSPLKGTEDVGELYVPMGCVLESSYANSSIALERGFEVEGESGGFCAANVSPKYRGVMTIRFCQPNHIDSPAGVRLVGLWVADVKPGGTTLEAYDSSGRMLSAITTTRRGSEFLGIESAVPIAYLLIRPNESREDPSSYDPNYAIDDLMFETPLSLSQELDQFTVVLGEGQMLRGSQLEVAGEELVLTNLTVGIDEVRVPAAEVTALMPTCFSSESVVPTENAFVMTQDGSVLRVVPTPEGFRLARRESVPVANDQIVALWGAETPFAAVPTTWQGELPLLLLGHQEFALTEATWGETWVETSLLEQDDADTEVAEPAEHEDARNRIGNDRRRTPQATLDLESITYATSPMLWLKPQPQVASDQARIRLASGEEFVFTESGFQLLDWNHEQVRLRSGEETLEIPISEVVLLVTETPGS